VRQQNTDQKIKQAILEVHHMFRFGWYLAGFAFGFCYFVSAYLNLLYRRPSFLVLFHVLLFAATGVGSFIQDYRGVVAVVGPAMFFMLVVMPLLSAVQALRMVRNMATGFGWYVVPPELAEAWPGILATTELTVVPYPTGTGTNQRPHSDTSILVKYRDATALLLASFDHVDHENDRRHDDVVWFMLPDGIVAPLVERTLLALGAAAMGTPLTVKVMMMREGDVSGLDDLPVQMGEHRIEVSLPDRPTEYLDNHNCAVTWFPPGVITANNNSVRAYAGTVKTGPDRKLHAVLSLEYSDSLLPRRSREKQRFLGLIVHLLTQLGWQRLDIAAL